MPKWLCCYISDLENAEHRPYQVLFGFPDMVQRRRFRNGLQEAETFQRRLEKCNKTIDVVEVLITISIDIAMEIRCHAIDRHIGVGIVQSQDKGIEVFDVNDPIEIHVADHQLHARQPR